MSDPVLTQWLIDVTRGPLREAFRVDPVQAASRLDPSVQQAVHAQDIAALWLADAHPMALLYFSRLCGWDNERYYSCIAQAQAHQGAS